MALNLNRVLLAGNLTRDPELRCFANDRSVANFGLAVNRRTKGSDGQSHDEATFVDCEAWGKDADLIAKHLAKGRGIFIEGRLKLETWEDKTDGTKRSKLKIVVERFHFVDSAPSDRQPGDADETAPAPRPRRASSTTVQDPPF